MSITIKEQTPDYSKVRITDRTPNKVENSYELPIPHAQIKIFTQLTSELLQQFSRDYKWSVQFIRIGQFVLLWLLVSPLAEDLFPPTNPRADDPHETFGPYRLEDETELEQLRRTHLVEEITSAGSLTD